MPVVYAPMSVKASKTTSIICNGLLCRVLLYMLKDGSAALASREPCIPGFVPSLPGPLVLSVCIEKMLAMQIGNLLPTIQDGDAPQQL